MSKKLKYIYGTVIDFILFNYYKNISVVA